MILLCSDDENLKNVLKKRTLRKLFSKDKLFKLNRLWFVFANLLNNDSHRVFCKYFWEISRALYYRSVDLEAVTKWRTPYMH